MRSRKAAGWRETTISPLITQRVCDFQVLIFVLSWSITGHKWFPKWAAQGRGWVNSFSTAFPLWGCSEHSEPERVGRQSPPRQVEGERNGTSLGHQMVFPSNIHTLCVTLAWTPHLSEPCPCSSHRDAVRHPIKRNSGKHHIPNPTTCLS